MTQANSKLGGLQSKFNVTLTAWIVVGIVVALLLHYLVITVVSPLMHGDGVASFTGAKKDAAQKAVDVVRTLIDNKKRWAYAIHVNDVHTTTDQEKAQFCGGDRAHVTHDATDPHYYTVVVNTKPLFSYAAATTQVLPGCSGSPSSW